MPRGHESSGGEPLRGDHAEAAAILPALERRQAHRRAGPAVQFHAVVSCEGAARGRIRRAATSAGQSGSESRSLRLPTARTHSKPLTRPSIARRGGMSQSSGSTRTNAFCADTLGTQKQSSIRLNDCTPVRFGAGMCTQRSFSSSARKLIAGRMMSSPESMRTPRSRMGYQLMSANEPLRHQKCAPGLYDRAPRSSSKGIGAYCRAS